MNGHRGSQLIYASIVIIIASLAVYLQGLHYPFVFDDYVYIVDDAKVKSLSGFWPPTGTRYFGYLTFALNYHFGGLDPFGYHAVNIAIHTINSLLVLGMVLLLTRTPVMETALREEKDRRAGFAVALSSALLFAVHPVNTQAVTYITQRFSSLATLFYLFAFVLYLKWRLAEKGPIRPAFYIIALVSVYMAQMTKEISFTLPFALLLTELAFFTGPLKRRLLALTPFLLAMAVIPLMLFGPGAGQGVGSTLLSDQLHDLRTMSRHDYLITQFRVIMTYLRLLALPLDQALDYGYPVYTSLFAPPVMASFLAILFLLFGAAYLFLRFLRGASVYLALISMGVFWFFITISVESSVIPIMDVIFEHRVYLPGVGAFIAFSGLVFLIISRLRLPFAISATAAIVLFSAPLAVAAYQRNLVWKTGISLWEDSVAKQPEKARSQYNLGTLYAKEGRMADAMRQFKKAIELMPSFSDPYNNIGNIYYSMGMFEEAAREYRKAVELNPENVEAIYNLGNVYMVLDMREESMAAFARFIEKANADFEQQKMEARESILKMSARQR